MKSFLIPASAALLLLFMQDTMAQKKSVVTKQKDFSIAGKQVKVFTTADTAGYRMAQTATADFYNHSQPFETEICVFVDPSKKFQTFFGIGGAVTDASAETFAKLPEARQKEFLTAYFSREKGIGYTVARTNINSCDFSSDMYTYVDENDKSLSSFNIEHDKKYKLPLIKQIFATSNNKVNLFASPWSPPAWMKDNNNMLQGGKLKPEFYNSWANYFVKFIREYEKQGVPVWGISIQNEPMAKQRWESCIYTAEEERDFLKNHLGPVMHSQGLANKKIIVWDHNRDLMYQRAQTYFSDPAAAKYAWGIGFHWYENWSGGLNTFDNVRKVYEAFPDKNIFFTEGCKERFDAAKYYDWALGEKYATNMINDFNNGMVGFTDWNILLDETGGPNHVGNFCFAPIHGDTKTGELVYTNAYYYIGHFSKYILPGAKRVISSPSRSALSSTAFLNPNGQLVVIVMNSGNTTVPYKLWIKGKAADVTALPHSIQTLVL
ncbi:MAG: glycoside hydrolase family 30 protein [Ferruginibacter sp.]